MLFNSLEFALFLPVILILFHIVPQRGRWGLLLGASFLFYSFWRPAYLILIVTSIIVDYIAGIRIESSNSERTKKLFLYLSIVTNIGLLFFFKYFNFLSGSLLGLFTDAYPQGYKFIDVLLPVGISFYTFQTMGYTIDVYRRKLKAERHLGYFALYVSFFPQLVAGPIERAGHLLPQLRTKKHIESDDFLIGISRIIFGLFKKVVIADRLALFSDEVFSHATAYSGLPLIIGVVFFTFQIYCDFSGYTDIALGIARMMGIRLLENFKSPYIAHNINEFWRRWHISLSAWFKDYLYIPIGGNRISIPRKYLNLAIVFALSGFWHGANWTFMIWGLIHGVMIILWNILKPFNLKIPRFLGVVITFTLVSLAWIFFRADSLFEACYILKNIVSPLSWGGFLPGLTLTELVLSFVFIALMGLIHLKFETDLSKFTTIKPMQRVFILSALVVIIFCFGIFNENQFIYFQF